MQLSDFEYELPEGFIAQTPAKSRDASRLMVVPKKEGSFEHKSFGDFAEGVLLVLNDTRVIPARLRGQKQTGGKTELLLDRPLGEVFVEDGRHCQSWACLVNASRPLREGVRVFLPAEGEARDPPGEHARLGQLDLQDQLHGLISVAKPTSTSSQQPFSSLCSQMAPANCRWRTPPSS